MKDRIPILIAFLACSPSLAFADAMDGGSTLGWFWIGLVVMVGRFHWVLLPCLIVSLALTVTIQFRKGNRGLTLVFRSTGFAVLSVLGGYSTVYTSWFLWCMFARM